MTVTIEGKFVFELTAQEEAAVKRRQAEDGEVSYDVYEGLLLDRGTKPLRFFVPGNVSTS